ncbi:MAG: DHH family phosphoesterase [DPANN group archaeon]|nr:DHH family phosphoesterase [DPANN group archaeon]
MLAAAADFIRKCRPEKTVIVYHKTCGDGICATAVIARTFKKLTNKFPKIIPYAYDEDFGKLTAEIKKYGSVIFLDLSIDKYKDELLKLKNSSDVLIIDHHELTNNMNENGILHIHPKFFYSGNSSRYVGAKLAYDICSQLADIFEMSWLAAAGLIHDVGSEDWKKFMDDVYRQFPELREGKNIYGFDCRLGQIVSVITAASFSAQAEKIAIGLCIEAKDPMAILERKYPEAVKLMNFKDKINKDIKKYVNNWKSLCNYNIDLNLAVCEIKSRHAIGGPVSTILSLKNTDIIFVTYKVGSKIVNFNIRNQNIKINCSDLAKNVTAKLENGTGGGHIPAAGGSFAAKDLNRFLELLPKIAKEMLKK